MLDSAYQTIVEKLTKLQKIECGDIRDVFLRDRVFQMLFYAFDSVHELSTHDYVFCGTPAAAARNGTDEMEIKQFSNPTEMYHSTLTTNKAKLASLLKFSPHQSMKINTIRLFLKAAPHLSSLFLMHTQRVLQDNDLLVCAQLCMNLTEINISDCNKLTDKSVCAIIVNSPKLITIDCTNVTKLTNAVIDAIVNSECRKCMEVFKFNGCLLMTDVDKLSVCKRLRL